MHYPSLVAAAAGNGSLNKPLLSRFFRGQVHFRGAGRPVKAWITLMRAAFAWRDAGSHCKSRRDFELHIAFLHRRFTIRNGPMAHGVIPVQRCTDRHLNGPRWRSFTVRTGTATSVT